MQVLIIVAHPDDEVLGCGGTIAKHVQCGDEVYCLILGEGIMARKADRASVKEKLEALRQEALKAAEILGTKEVLFKSFPDQKLDAVTLLEIIKAIEDVKRRIKPDIIYTHHHGDLNIDHQITFNAVLTACRPLLGETVHEIYCFEIASSTEWNSPEAKNYFMPNVFVDISETFVKKMEALKAYKSEIRQYPHPRSPEALEITAKRWGVTIGKDLAEAFRLIRWIK